VIILAIAPALAIALGLLFVSEIALRVRFGEISAITGAAEWRAGEWEGLTYFWDRYDPSLGWTNLPGYRSDDRVPFGVRINAQGLRGDRDYAPSPPRGVRRIAVFGDSCVFGTEVDDDSTVPALLEGHLEAAEVLNFGVTGYGLGQMVLRLETEGFALAPDHVVVVILIPSDLSRDPMSAFTHPKPTFSVESGQLVIGNVPVPVASRQPWALRTLFTAAWLWGRPREARSPDDLRALLTVTEALLARLRAGATARGIDVTLVPIMVASTLDQLDSVDGYRSAIDGIRAWISERGLDVHDPIDALEQAYRQHGQRLVARRGHWARPGNCLLAKSLAGGLAKSQRWRLAPNPPPCL